MTADTLRTAPNRGKKEKLAPAGSTAARRSVEEEKWFQLFQTLDRDRDNHIFAADLKSAFNAIGLAEDDRRIRRFLDPFLADPKRAFSFEEFYDVFRQSDFAKKALSQDLAIRNFSAFCDQMVDIYEKTKTNRTGQVANYIPQLARVDPELFGVSICSIDGQRFSYGDANTDFCVQSCSKPITYSMVVEDLGLDAVHKHVGREPSGRGFNDFVFDHQGLPHNPMINSGAIMCCSMIKQEMERADRFDHILATWADLTGGGKVGFHNPTYLSERDTADRNFALAHFMRENKAFPKDADLTTILELYFQICSITVDADSMAVAAATFANGGVCPTTGQRIFKPETVRSCLSLMYSCGMYDYSGEFAFQFGLPAKSGVSGALMVIVPNVMGLCVWSPRLDRLGNSVRGISFCKELVGRFNFHIFDQLVPGLCANVTSSKDSLAKSKLLDMTDFYYSSAGGDLANVKRLVARGVDFNQGDYDGRTALHLAAAEGRLDVVSYLIQLGAQPKPIDRWGATPQDEAARYNHHEIVSLLKSYEKRSIN